MPDRNAHSCTGKAALRARARARRAALSPAGRAAASAKIAAHCLGHAAVAAARTVFVYVSTSGEVATHDLIDRLTGAGRQVLVPSLTDRTTMLAVPFPGWTGMRPGARGILAPPPGPPWNGPVDVALLPGLAFTRRGDRLGYGAGYYDRWLAVHPHTLPLALAFTCQVVDRVPVAPHDRPVAAIITEDGVCPGPE